MVNSISGRQLCEREYVFMLEICHAEIHVSAKSLTEIPVFSSRAASPVPSALLARKGILPLCHVGYKGAERINYLILNVCVVLSENETCL